LTSLRFVLYKFLKSYYFGAPTFRNNSKYEEQLILGLMEYFQVENEVLRKNEKEVRAKNATSLLI